MGYHMTTPKNIGRVLGSQIYVGTSPESAKGDVPFAERDVFINTNSGYVYQYDGAEWVFKYVIATAREDIVRRAYDDAEALGFDPGTVALVAPIGGVAKVVRVVTDAIGNKSLEDISVGDGVLPFITKAVSDLQNYYLKSETYTQTEIDAKLDALPLIEFREVDELPQVGESNVIYLVPHLHEGQLDRYDEYCWVANKQRFEKLGNTDALANYYNKTETDGLLALKADKAPFDAHVADTTNPHGVTKAQVGLGNVDNTSDVNKPVSTAQQAALDLKANQSEFSAHANNQNNPHGVTKSQVGLGNVDNTSDANKPVSVATQGALDLKADKATTYTKSETNALLATKANSADVYAKVEADALLATKQNVLTFDPQPTANSTNPVTSGGVKSAIDSAISSVYRYKGSVETYAQLPISGMSVGDVYNVEEADPTHAVSAGDNVAWDGMTWDVLAGTIDLGNYYTITQVDSRLADKADKATTYLKTEVDSALATKQDTLISGTNIKTINSHSILGGGDLELYTVATDAEIMALFVSVENNTIIASGSVSENVMSGSGWSVSNNTLNM